MKTKLTFFALLLISLAQAQSLAWSKNISGSSRPSLFHMTGDVSGNIFTTGWFNGPVDFDPGSATYSLNSNAPSAFISKLDASGNFMWAVNLSTPGTGSIITGSSNGRYGICTDVSGSVYLAGFFSGVCDFDPGPSTYTLASAGSGLQTFVWKLNANGGFEWAKQVPPGISINSCIIDGSGDLLVAGLFQGSCDFDWGSGVNQFTSIGAWDGYIAKLDNSGNFIELKQFGSTGSYNRITSLSLGALSEIQAVGSYSVAVDADPGSGTHLLSAAGNNTFTVRLDAGGNFLSAVSLSSLTGSTSVSNISMDIFGNTCVAGFFTGICDLDPSSGVYTVQSAGGSVFISKLSSTGVFTGAKTIATSTVTIPTIMYYLSDASGNDYLSSIFSDTLDCDPGPGIYTLNPSYGAFASILNGSGNFISGANILGTLVYADGSGNFYTTNSSPTDCIINKYSSILTGIKVNQKNTIGSSVFPNPSNGDFTFTSTSPDTKLHFEVYSIAGQKLLERNTEEKIISFDLKSFDAGVYLLRVSDSSGASSYQKLVKE